MNIGNKIRELRKQQGITQEQLAESIGISFQAVSKWENNIALPDITLAPVLASYFGVSMDELFDFNQKVTSDIQLVAKWEKIKKNNCNGNAIILRYVAILICLSMSIVVIKKHAFR